MIVITTPTGDIGHQVLKHVVQGSEPVRVIARDPSRIPQEIRQRIEVIQGSHGDAATIEKALNGADALFWLIPPDPFMALNRVDEAYADFTKPAAKAITNCAVKRVVSVCGIGRGWNKEAGLVTANVKADDVLARTGVALRTLMMPSFMENLLRQAPTIQEKGVFSLPILPALKAPLVATSDIATIAAKFLMDRTWTGQADLEDANTLRNLSEIEASRAIPEGFKKAINNLTVRQKGDAEIRDRIKLRDTRPFVVKDQGYVISDKSLFNRTVGDSGLELEFAAFLAKCNDVTAFAKNYMAVGFKLDYVKANGDISTYTPDFFVRRSNGEVWIVETKGREDLNDPGKWERLKQWCTDASALDSERHYHALFVREEDWDQYKPKNFHDAVAAFAE